jgi:hypothetical protein
VEADFDLGCFLAGFEIDDGDGAAVGDEAGGIGADGGRGSGGGGGFAGLRVTTGPVADVGGLADEDDAVGGVADGDFAEDLLRFEVDFGEGVTHVEDGVEGFFSGGEGEADGDGVFGIGSRADGFFIGGLRAGVVVSRVLDCGSGEDGEFDRFFGGEFAFGADGKATDGAADVGGVEALAVGGEENTGVAAAGMGKTRDDIAGDGFDDGDVASIEQRDPFSIGAESEVRGTTAEEDLFARGGENLIGRNDDAALHRGRPGGNRSWKEKSCPPREGNATAMKRSGGKERTAGGRDAWRTPLVVISGARMVLEMRRSYQRVFQGKGMKLQLNVVNLLDAD